MLRITRATDPILVDRLVLCIYSPPGVGKTSLSFTAEKPLLLDFDGGVHRAAMRHDTVRVETWDDVSAISADDLKNYKTVILDTAGRALDVLTTDIIKGNPKLGRSGGALTLQGYGELKSRFISFTKLMRSFGLDIVLLAHCDEQKNGDDLIERIDVQGGSKNEIYKAADVMGRLFIRNGKRYLNFNPSDTSFGKNPGQLAEMEVPAISQNPSFLAEVIAQVKTNLNRLTADQQAAANVLAEWQIKFDSAKTSGEFNDFIDQMSGLPDAVKTNVGRLWVKSGKAKGWEQDKDTKRFTAPENPAAVESTASPNGNGHSDKFNPISQTTKDGLTKTQAKKIQELSETLKLENPDTAATDLFGMFVTVDELSKEGAERFIADLTARSEGAMF